MTDLEIIDTQRPVRHQPAAQSTAVVYLARLAPRSGRTMAGALRTIADLAQPGSDPITVPWHRLRYQQAQAPRAQIGARYAPATANKLLAALRGVLNESWHLGQTSDDGHSRAADVGSVRGHRLPKGRALAATELSALLHACDVGDAIGLRAAALPAY